MMVVSRIKSVLAEKQVSRKWLAQEIGCTVNTLSHWVTRYNPLMESFREFADALEVDIRDLLRLSKNRYGNIQ